MKPRFTFIIGGLLLAALSVFNACQQPQAPASSPGAAPSSARVTAPAPMHGDVSGLNRHPHSIHYSKHARCRMSCRHISEPEVKEILASGEINLRKSELDAPPCRKRYAVEGITRDNQRVRIIFAPCEDEETVVTVIDLGREWSCDCK